MHNTYLVGEKALTAKQKVVVCLLAWPIFSFGMFFAEAIPPSRSAYNSYSLTLAASLIVFGLIGLMFSATMVFILCRKPWLSRYTLHVDQYEFIAVIEINFSSKVQTHETIVRKGKIRTLSDYRGWSGKRAGFRLSEKGKWASYFSGSIFVPDTLPTYAELRQVAESWRIPENL